MAGYSLYGGTGEWFQLLAKAACWCGGGARRTEGPPADHRHLGGSLPTPSFSRWRNVWIAEWWNLGAERYAGNSISVVVPNTVGSGKIIRFFHPALEHAGKLPHFLRVPRIVGHVPDLPRVSLKVVQLEPRARNLEQPPLRRGEPTSLGASA